LLAKNCHVALVAPEMVDAIDRLRSVMGQDMRQGNVRHVSTAIQLDP
jgi:hypothetical protein